MRKLNKLFRFLLATRRNPRNATFHVSPHGDDGNDGSERHPLRTIGKAARLARPGDTVTVHAGIYREHVDPPRGGRSDQERILYQAAPGETVEIRGSEIVAHWVRFEGSVWKAHLDNRIFGDYNPYSVAITGDWFLSREHVVHTGEVFLNDKALCEKDTLEQVLPPPTVDEKPELALVWFCKTDRKQTIIYANFAGYDPNREKVEVTVRKACFYPKRTGINFITVRGFIMTQAATQWAPPTAEQIGLIGTNWSKGWIIEGNTVSNSKCTGITLGKDRKSGNNVGDPRNKGRVPRGVKLYNKMVDGLIQKGWGKAQVGSHIIRNNEIFNCGQAGICGSLGAIFSTISNNHIHEVHDKKEFFGLEIAGIKIHGAIDVTIEGNRIHNTHKAIWLDWMAQGARISRNLCYRNEHQDLFLEASHGPVLVDNNLFLSRFSIRSGSPGGAFVHNLIAGHTFFFPEPRPTPVFRAHSTQKLGLYDGMKMDYRIYNNIFAGSFKLAEVPERMARMTTLSCYVDANVYLKNAVPHADEKNFIHEDGFAPKIKLERSGSGLFMQIDYAESIQKLDSRLVTTETLGETQISLQRFENPDGSALAVDTDFFGKPRPSENPLAGPFEHRQVGTLRICVAAADPIQTDGEPTRFAQKLAGAERSVELGT